VEGDELVLLPPSPAAFDPQEPELRARLEAAARTVCGRALRLRVADTPAPAGRAGPPDGDLEQRIRAEWPGAERVDS